MGFDYEREFLENRLGYVGIWGDWGLCGGALEGTKMFLREERCNWNIQKN